jgi:hypothetical protein
MTAAPPFLVLTRGKHASPAQGLCATELAAVLAGEPHSDHPETADRVLAAAARPLNDDIRDDMRRTRIMRPVSEALVGSRVGHVTELRRAFIMADWAVRYLAPADLEAVGLTEQAARLRALPPIVDAASARVSASAAKACMTAYSATHAERSCVALAANAALVAAHAPAEADYVPLTGYSVAVAVDAAADPRAQEALAGLLIGLANAA